METTLQIPFLPCLDLVNSLTDNCEGLSLQQLSILGCVYLNVNRYSIQTLFQFMKKHVEIQVYVNLNEIDSITDIITIIDAGAIKVFVNSSQGELLKEYSDRLVLIETANMPASRQANNSSILLDIPDLAVVESYLQSVTTEKMYPIYLMTTTSDLDSYVALAQRYSVVPIFSTMNLTISSSTEGKVSIPKYISAVWKSDREDKLVATIVTDVRGFVLGLVYSSENSLAESLRTGTGVYQSRKRGLWYKGATSGDTQKLIRICMDCDLDSLKFVVQQNGRGFCHLPQSTCFGNLHGLAKLENTLMSRKKSAPEASYTARLFSDEKLLHAKIMEEAQELCDAKTKNDVAFEAADLIYFALTKAIGCGISLTDIERNLDAKSLKVKRRRGDAKNQLDEKTDTNNINSANKKDAANENTNDSSNPDNLPVKRISMKRFYTSTTSPEAIRAAIKRPSQKSTDAIMGIVKPIIQSVRENGDKALLDYTHKFEKATSLISPILRAPFPPSLMDLSAETIEAIDISYENIRKFHTAQKDEKSLQVETMPGVICSRFSRPIERVGLYVPGGTAVLPSTALMLGVPAMVAECKKIVIATPPRSDGSITPEIVYVAHKVGAESIVLAGGAQAVAAMAYGTESVSKVDKILGPGNQFVTAAKMFVSNDTNAGVSIDMPAGPSEVLVIADKSANPAFVASDLLSQAEHGIDSQVILIAIDLSEDELTAIDNEIHTQAIALPRVDIIRRSIEHSVTLVVKSVKEAIELSNDYAPEHLILQMNNAGEVIHSVTNAGSIFIGDWTPESVGDYSAGVNHSLPTYGYAKQYSGVSLSSFTKYITSSQLSTQGLLNVGRTVMQLAKVEELEAHRRAVEIRLKYIKQKNL
ncbi:Histidine biosynthesis trifunctional protein [Golovinomyces cichoracearum]|uniref:Histidine biosynthesis trifunctional protein n=1 Tax=Golovinomyces cichoracearum TaxID=62708 RepID=A0A420IDJ0_9PEZI|nr:Histidine biosynthesis trifunctional protein [Golovinomyces cichoracearum]